MRNCCRLFLKCTIESSNNEFLEMFFSDFSFLLQLVSLSYPRQVFFFPCQQSCKMYWRRSFMLFLYCFFNVWPSPFILDSSVFFNLLIHRSSWEVIDYNHLFKHPPSNFVHFLYCLVFSFIHFY